jgi:hypothetical protein
VVKSSARSEQWLYACQSNAWPLAVEADRQIDQCRKNCREDGYGYGQAEERIARGTGLAAQMFAINGLIVHGPAPNNMW